MKKNSYANKKSILINNCMAICIHILVSGGYILLSSLNIYYYSNIQENMLFLVLPVIWYCLLSCLLLKPVKRGGILSTISVLILVSGTILVTALILGGNSDVTGLIIYLINPVFAIETMTAMDGLSYVLIPSLIPFLLIWISLLVKVFIKSVIRKLRIYPEDSDIDYLKNKVLTNKWHNIRFFSYIILFVITMLSIYIYLSNQEAIITGKKMEGVLDKVNEKEYLTWDFGNNYVRNTNLSYARDDTILISYSPDYKLEMRKYGSVWYVNRIINEKVISHNPKYAHLWRDYNTRARELNYPVDYIEQVEHHMVSPDKSRKIVYSYDDVVVDAITVKDLNGEKITIDVLADEVFDFYFLDNETIVQLAILDDDNGDAILRYGDLRLIFYNVTNGTSYSSKVDISR